MATNPDVNSIYGGPRGVDPYQDERKIVTHDSSASLPVGLGMPSAGTEDGDRTGRNPRMSVGKDTDDIIGTAFLLSRRNSKEDLSVTRLPFHPSVPK